MNEVKTLLCAYDALLWDIENAKNSKQRVEASNAANNLRKKLFWLVDTAMWDEHFEYAELLSLYQDVHCGYVNVRYPALNNLDITELLIDNIQQFDNGTLYRNIKPYYRKDDFDDMYGFCDEIDSSWAENGWLSDDDYILHMLSIPDSDIKHHRRDTADKIHDEVCYDKVHDITWEDFFAAQEYYESVA